MRLPRLLVLLVAAAAWDSSNALFTHDLTCSATCDGSVRSAVRWNDPGLSCTIDVLGALEVPAPHPVVVDFVDLEAGRRGNVC